MMNVRQPERSLRILVADEPADWVKSFFDRLNACTVDVLMAANERQGMEIIRRERVDLALIAGDLPQVGGLEFIRRVHRVNVEMPVIVLGGESNRRWLEEALKAGVRTILPRPVNVSMLAELSIKLLSM